jgi:HEAT repeat protein
VSEEITAKLLRVIQRLDPEYRVQGQRAIEYLRQSGGNSLEGLLAILDDPNASTEKRLAACWVLGRLDDPTAVTALLHILEEENAELRAAAARALGELGSAQMAVPVLVAAMRSDTEAEVRKSATYALGLLGDQRAVEPLVGVLESHHDAPEVRGMAAEALADLGSKEAIAQLVTALEDASVEVRFWAAFALGSLGEAEVIPDLERAATTDNAVFLDWGPVSEEATRAIERIERRQAMNMESEG